MKKSLDGVAVGFAISALLQFVFIESNMLIGIMLGLSAATLIVSEYFYGPKK